MNYFAQGLRTDSVSHTYNLILTLESGELAHVDAEAMNLLKERTDFRKKGNYKKADEVRDKLLKNKGIEILYEDGSPEIQIRHEQLSRNPLLNRLFYDIKDSHLDNQKKNVLMQRINALDYNGFSYNATHGKITENYVTASQITDTITDPRFRMGSDNSEQKMALFSKILSSVSNDMPLDIVAYGGAVKNPYASGFAVDISNNGHLVLKKGKPREPSFAADVAEEGMLRNLDSLRTEIEKEYMENPIEITLVTAGELAAQANGTSRALSKKYENSLTSMAKELGYGFIKVRDIGTFYKDRKADIEKIRGDANRETEEWFSGLDHAVLSEERRHAAKNIYPPQYRESSEEIRIDDAVKRYKLLHLIDEKIDVFEEWDNTIRLGLVKGNGNRNGRVDIWPIREESIASPWQGVGYEYWDRKGIHIDVLTPENMESGYTVNGSVLRIGNEKVN